MSKTIVAADDEAHILHVLSRKLKNGGYRVVTAMDGEEALELCLSEDPDLLITDYQMPIMSGLELCRALRSHEGARRIPAIMLTARGFDIEPEEMIEAGISAVITKPFSPRALLRRVDEMLGVSEPAPAMEGT